MELLLPAKRVAPKPGQKKVTAKPKPPKVIEISPNEQVQKDKSVNKKQEGGDAISKRKSQTLTSVLTARSKAACGLTKKPKEQIIDIDAADAGNELPAFEHIEDIYKFYKVVENDSHPHHCMDSQPEINERMRAVLIDWLIDASFVIVKITAICHGSKIPFQFSLNPAPFSTLRKDQNLNTRRRG